MSATMLAVPGLAEAVEVLIDRWGIPHVYARTARDLYVAQGFTAARFRLWQMDLWRKRGLGLLAQSFGAGFVEQDRARRLFLYRGDMAAEWAAYGPGVREILEAFVQGINAYVGLTETGAVPLPPEFAWSADRPALWRAEDILRIRNVGLRMNLGDEVARCRLAALGALEADALRRQLDPAHRLTLPPGLDPAAIPAEALRVYNLALAELDLSDPAAGAVPTSNPAADPAANPAANPAASPAASNVWAIAPGRSASGRPILANDPHRTHTLPSLRWLVHLVAPGIAAAGATEPVHPGISNGHNADLAFGFTYSACDQEDLFVYDTDPADPLRYRWAGGWERMNVVEEAVPVRDAAPETVRLLFTRHGPVIHEDRAAHRAIAVRSAFLEPGGAPYLAGVDYHRARDLGDFQARLHRAVAPTLNYCAADAAGRIGIFARGRVPVRRGWDGLVPAPGDGSCDWTGFVAPEDLPTEIDPAQGWVGSCNQTPPPADYPFDARRIGFEFSDRSRFERLTALFAARERISPADCRAFQTDRLLAQGPALAQAALGAGIALPPALAAALAAWDGTMDEASPAAAFLAHWLEGVLRPELVAALAPSGTAGIVGEGDLRRLLRPPLPPSVLARSVAAALAELTRRLGPDPAGWRLGDLQTVALAHPLSARIAAARIGDIAPAPLGGHANTLNKAASFGGRLAVKHGPSFRLVMEVGNWNETAAINMPGQSGDPTSPHYRDLFEAWRRGDYVPLLWDRAAIEEATTERLTLEPA